MQIEELLEAWAKQVIRAQTAEAKAEALAAKVAELEAQKPEEPVNGTR